MNLIRFMGEKEFSKYISGETLSSNTVWRPYDKDTPIGFCFFPGGNPEERLHYISGVVDFDMVCEFETIGPVNIRKAVGRYRDPEQDLPKTIMEALLGPVRMMEVTEYSMEQYNKKTLKLLRAGTVSFSFENSEWYIRWLPFEYKGGEN